jgi:hypothetical protein
MEPVMTLVFLTGGAAFLSAVIGGIQTFYEVARATRTESILAGDHPKPDPALVAALGAQQQLRRHNAPPTVRAKVDRTIKSVRRLLPLLDRLGPGSAQAHLVRASATNYLPTAVAAYLKLPRELADTQPVSGGKTGLDLLCEQLDLINTALDKVAITAATDDAKDLIVHGMFLEDKFAASRMKSVDK